mmetsp:Transcript_2239/g.6788  ORF Transcript_2239/g.6788 Transcript_2239/m.6788 type:complete len:108 (+) Transcript_2239:151-474(+)
MATLPSQAGYDARAWPPEPWRNSSADRVGTTLPLTGTGSGGAVVAVAAAGGAVAAEAAGGAMTAAAGSGSASSAPGIAGGAAALGTCIIATVPSIARVAASEGPPAP